MFGYRLEQIAIVIIQSVITHIHHLFSGSFGYIVFMHIECHSGFQCITCTGTGFTVFCRTADIGQQRSSLVQQADNIIVGFLISLSCWHFFIQFQRMVQNRDSTHIFQQSRIEECFEELYFSSETFFFCCIHLYFTDMLIIYQAATYT